MDLLANTDARPQALGATSATVGAAVWLAAPWLSSGTRLAVASVEHLFLLMPLVVAPLALALVAERTDEGEGAPSLTLASARRLQPAAAALLLLSFLLPSGTAAGILTLPWLGLALLVAATGVSDVVRRRVRSPGASLIAARLFLAVGAGWLLLWRLGTGPRTLSPVTVAIAALHFHFNGFSSQVLFGATGRRLPRTPAWLHPLHGIATVAAIAGLPVLAVGKALSLPVARILGVGATTLALIALSVTMSAVALRARSAATRTLLVAAAACGAAAAGLASAFGAGELAGQEWISLPTMLASHGLLMSLGFTVCGLVGHLRLLRE